MEKFKIYVHHKYSNQYFWYFFHGVDIEFPPLEFIQPILFSYKGKEFEVIFTEDNWDKKDGFHIFDYHVSLMQNNEIVDRGYYEKSAKKFKLETIPFLNKVVKTLNNKLSIFIIDWESGNPYFFFDLKTKLDKRIQVFGDEMKSNLDTNISNKHFSFTHTITSFLFPDTLGIKTMYRLSDYVKKEKSSLKINFPIRRLYGKKVDILNFILNKKLKNINVSLSSYHQTVDKKFDNKFIFDSLKETATFINKRNYGLDDFGGESNSENMNEFIWKVLHLADINIINEYTPIPLLDEIPKEFRESDIGYSFITEKTISHIFSKKPFLPIHYSTIEFYENICNQYNKILPKFPLKYFYITDILEQLNSDIEDEQYYNKLLEELTNWVTKLQKNIIDIINSNNNYLDYLLDYKEESSSNLL